MKRERPAPDLFIGTGKVEELALQAQLSHADVAIFGRDLSPTQQRNLEEILGIKVIDRTQLILDIFAQRARSQEGKVQVELAQLQYLLPRLAGKGVLLSRLGGGIGTRGPGEQKLEVDRRRIRFRIARLKKELTELKGRRDLVRQKREEEEVPMVAMIGYTNAGKSTLFNRLTQAAAPAANQLFTTLDPLARRLTLPSRQAALLSDTVGFLHQLPHHLIDAFRATLEEVRQSRLLLHVVDVSHPMFDEQMSAVEEVLGYLEAESHQRIIVFNKIDRIDPHSRQALRRRCPEAVLVSAMNGEGVSELLARLAGSLGSLLKEAQIVLPPKDQRWLGRIYKEGEVLKRTLEEDRVVLMARIPKRLYGQLAKAGLVRS